ncbi:MAG: hypothetical protein VZS44_03680 [Bacilli bacterium]|nr:hypothetical protein [Bacilli bacterium]
MDSNIYLKLPITKDVLDTIHIYAYEKPKLGINNQEYLDNILNNGKDITNILIRKKVCLNGINH